MEGDRGGLGGIKLDDMWREIGGVGGVRGYINGRYVEGDRGG